MMLDEDGRSGGVDLFQFCYRRDRVSGESSPACSLTGHWGRAPPCFSQEGG